MFETHLHPFLSSFPFVLLSCAVCGEVYSLYRPSIALQRYVFVHLLIAVMMIGAAFLSGYVAAPHAHQVLQKSEEVISYHHLWGKATLILSVVTLLLRWIAERARYNQGGFATLFRLSLIALWVLTLCTGYLGGSMLLVGPD